MKDSKNIFEEYKEIEPNDYLQKIKFYEERSQQIFALVDDQQYFLKFEFVSALFDLGRYSKVLVEIEDLIEYVFLNNVSYAHGDSFVELIFIKAAANYHTQDYDQSINLCKQLLAMKPANRLYKELLKNAFKQKLKQNFTDLRLVAILIILVTAIIGGVYYFKYGIVNNEYKWPLILINVFALSGISVILLTFDLMARHRMRCAVRDIISKKKDNQ